MNDHIKIGHYVYTVHRVKELRSDNGRTLFGEIDYTKQQILILDEISPERFETVLWHEILHAIFEQAGQQAGDSSLEAMIISASHGIVQVLRDNPWLTKVRLAQSVDILRGVLATADPFGR